MARSLLTYDIRAIIKTTLLRAKTLSLGKASYGSQRWAEADPAWYKHLHQTNIFLHHHFQNYLTSKTDVQSILEIGCGTGVYPILYKKILNKKEYTGLDFSPQNIKYCRQHSDFNFIAGDFLKIHLDAYDMIYSHATIDHVPNPDEFLHKVVQLTNKYAYISSYSGYFPNTLSHKQNWREQDKCYYNALSAQQIKKVLLDSELDESEFTIQKVFDKENEQTVVIIERKSDYSWDHK